MDRDEIPLLSGKDFVEFSPLEFKEYIRSLFFKKEPRKAAPKKKKEFSWTRNKKGTFSLRVRREPKWLSEEEMNSISAESGVPLSEIFIKMQEKDIIISTQSRADEIKLELDSIPF